MFKTRTRSDEDGQLHCWDQRSRALLNMMMAVWRGLMITVAINAGPDTRSGELTSPVLLACCRHSAIVPGGVVSQEHQQWHCGHSAHWTSTVMLLA